MVGACSKEDLSRENSPNESPSVEYNGPRVQLEAQGSYDDNSFRAKFTIKERGKPELTKPMPATVDVHCFIRSNVPGQPMTSLTLKWKWDSEAQRYYYSYKEAAVALATGTDLSQGEWYIAGMIGGTRQGDQVKVKQTAILKRVSENDKVEMDVPFLFPWTRLNIIEVNGEPTLRVPDHVTFSPQGVLLRHTFENEMYNAWEISRLDVISNAFYDDATFSFENVASAPTVSPTTSIAAIPAVPLRLGTPSQGWLMSYTLGGNTLGSSAAPLKIEAATSNLDGDGNWVSKTPATIPYHYLSWAMPAAQEPSEPHTAAYVNINTAFYSNGTKVPNTRSAAGGYHVFYSGDMPKSGKTYTVLSVIRRRPTALEYLAEYNLSGPKTFATTNEFMTNEGNKEKYFPIPSFSQMEAFISANIPDGYRLGETSEMAGIFGASSEELYFEKISQNPTAPTTKSGQYSYALRGNLRPYYDGHYVVKLVDLDKRETIVYGLRWIDRTTTSIENNYLRSAWRYKFVSNIAPVGAPECPALIITSRYLGPVSNVTIQDIAQESFWENKSAPKDEEATRIIPLSGYSHQHPAGTPAIYLAGKQGMLMLHHTTPVNQITQAFFRPEKMGTRTNKDILHYVEERTNTFLSDPAGTFYNAGSIEEYALPVRPLKTHNFKVRYRTPR